MLPKKNRVDSNTIKEIFSNGRVVFFGNLSLRYLKNKKQGKMVSVIVSKSIAKKASERNFLRRRGYDAIAKNFDKYPDGFAGVLVFGPRGPRVFGAKYPKEEKIKSLNNLNYEVKNIFDKVR